MYILRSVSTGEIPLSELGLASWSPAGLIQASLEMLHVGLVLPWWLSIVLGKETITFY